MRTLLRFLVRTAVLAVLGTIAVFVMGMRANNAAVQGAVKRFNRDVGNKRQLKTAGNAGAWASVVHHVGRTSGREYKTPIVPIAHDDEFIVLLPYGPDVDWLKNVQAAGTATLVHKGETFTVGHAEVVPSDSVLDKIPASEQRMRKIFAVDQCVVLRPVS